MAFCFVFLWIQKMTKWSAKGFLIGHLLAMGAIPAWGCVGFFTEAVGLHHKAEFWIIAVLYGANLGSAQAFARSIFGSMIPPGREAQWYSLYEITDKGSSWLGPLVASLLPTRLGRRGAAAIVLRVVGELSQDDGDEPQARKRGRTFDRDAERRARERAEAEQARRDAK